MPKQKERITITIDKELLDWLDVKIKNKVFSNRSHGLEVLSKIMKKEHDWKGLK